MGIFGFIVSNIDGSYRNGQYSNQTHHLRPREGTSYYHGHLDHRA